MKIVVDESVSYSVVTYLRDSGFDVIAIVERSTAGLDDSKVYELVKKERAVLITRDHHFCNNLRYPSSQTTCIIYIRKGNLASNEELELIKWFFYSYSLKEYEGRLITLSKDRVKIR